MKLDEGRSWALLHYYTPGGLELGQQGVGTHNELGQAFTNASTWRTIDRFLSSRVLYTRRSLKVIKRNGTEERREFSEQNT